MQRIVVWIPVLAALWCAAGADLRPGEPRIIWSGAEVTLLGTPSLDGRFLSFADPASGNLALRETSTGAVRQITSKPAGSKEFAYFSTISPDSARVAYAWFNDEGFYDLRAIDANGKNSRILYRNPEAGFVQPCAWSPDGTQILTLFFRTDNISQIGLVPVEGGPPKILRSLNWVYPKRMDLSPDGRFIVYDSFANAESGDRTIFLLSTDGAKESRLVNSPGNHLFPLWTPDGRSIVFASDRDGTMDVWAIDVVDGQRKGEARPLRRDAGRILPMGITRDGDYYYGIRMGETEVFITDFEMPGENARRATLRYPGRNTAPVWSPDGKFLAYLSRRGSENFGQESRAIAIRSVASQEERELLPKLAHMERLRWSRDGRSLLVSGSDNKGRAGLYIVDCQTAALKPLAVEAGASFRGFESAGFGDGVLHIQGDEVLSQDGAAVYRGSRPRHLTSSPDGRSFALVDGESSIVVVSGGEKTTISFPGVTELEWGPGPDLVAARGSELWKIPLDGQTPRRLKAPGNRQPGFSLHPDGKRIALTAGKAQAEVRVMRIAGR